MATSLSEARGKELRIISAAQRRNEMMPIELRHIAAANCERGRYALEVAQFKLCNQLLDQAAALVQEALAIALRNWFVAALGKPRSPVFEPERLLEKLRSRCCITREEYRCLGRIARGERFESGWHVEEAIEVVGRLLD